MKSTKIKNYGNKVLARLVDGNRSFIKNIRVPFLFDAVPGIPKVVSLPERKGLAILDKSFKITTYMWYGKPYIAKEEIDTE